MSTPATPTAIGPQTYQSLRTTSLGAATEAIEHCLILDLIGNREGAYVLDVGCGDGAPVSAAASRGPRATDIDPDPVMLAAARTRADKDGITTTFLEGRIERFPLSDAAFDVGLPITVLCFVADASAMRTMARVLRPGGRLVLGELGRWSLWAAILRLRGWLGAASWRAARFRTGGELRALAEQVRAFLRPAALSSIRRLSFSHGSWRRWILGWANLRPSARRSSR
ncbi:MAG: class I SAM-dependent methyltransferase [Beijerinckiaceae bacterium]|nr:MAG: class I SAM-dependent methyltransferase [Beijerinckiaceae bacterium]